jgi:hypothetical protein
MAFYFHNNYYYEDFLYLEVEIIDLRFHKFFSNGDEAKGGLEVVFNQQIDSLSNTS